MMQTCTSAHPDRFYRVERFKVPETSLGGFLEAVSQDHEVLRRLPGFVKDCVFEQTGGPGGLHVVTVAVWESQRAADAATALVAARSHKTIDVLRDAVRHLGVDAERRRPA